jgi:predicted membrane protein
MSRVSKHSILGLIIVFLGFILLFDSLGYIEFDFWRSIGKLWPLVLIIIGLIVIFKSREISESESSSNELKSSDFSGSALFGDVRVAGISGNVGNIDRSLLFGDIVIDLSGSDLQDGDNYVNVSVIFGDVDVTVPADFPVCVDLSCIAGSVSFGGKKSDGLMSKVRYADTDFDKVPAKLYIKGNTIFGDIRVIKSAK